MTDTEKKIHAIICDNAREHDPIQGYSHKYCLEETSAIFALIQQSNREYCNGIIGEDDEEYMYDGGIPRANNELRYQLRKKNIG
jgi:hypothetical protein